jgi:hypothetical protein
VNRQYDDDYATCARTYVTLCVYPPAEMDPAEVTGRLGLEATSSHRIGELRPVSTRRVPSRAWSRSTWFLSSEGEVGSRDVRRHIDWLLDHLTDRTLTLTELRAAGCETVLSCYWVSASGHGGPMLWPEQLARLAECGLELWFDVYCP